MHFERANLFIVKKAYALLVGKLVNCTESVCILSGKLINCTETVCISSGKLIEPVGRV